MNEGNNESLLDAMRIAQNEANLQRVRLEADLQRAEELRDEERRRWAEAAAAMLTTDQNINTGGLRQQMERSYSTYSSPFTQADLLQFISQLGQNNQSGEYIWHGNTAGAIFVDPAVENNNNEEEVNHMITVERNERNEPIIRVSDVKMLITSGYVRKRGDANYDETKKNSLMDLYNINRDAVDLLFSTGPLKNCRVVFPKDTDAKRTFELHDDTAEEAEQNEQRAIPSASIEVNDLIAGSGAPLNMRIEPEMTVEDFVVTTSNTSEVSESAASAEF